MIISVSFCEPRQTQLPESAVPSFGEKLRKEREQRKITLDDISSTTKISTRMLRALEDEHFDELPGGVFNKGFVRAYARHIGLDEEQAITDYLDATNQNPSGATPASVPEISAVAAQAAQMERLRSLGKFSPTKIGAPKHGIWRDVGQANLREFRTVNSWGLNSSQLGSR